MTIRTFTLVFLLSFLGASAVPARSQQPDVPSIYVSNERVTSPLPPESQKIVDAVAPMIDLRLRSMKEVRVTEGPLKCNSRERSEQGTPEPKGEQVQRILADASTVIYEVKTLLKTVITTAPGAKSSEELLLEYDILKYIKCKPISIGHRAVPMTLRTGFQDLLQVGDLIEVALKDDLDLLKTKVDLIDISVTGGEAQQALKDYMANNLLIKLSIEPDFKVGDLRGADPASSQADYLIRGTLSPKEPKGVEFTVENVKSPKKPEKFFIPGPIGEKSPDEKALAAFYENAALKVINSIRAQRDNEGPLTDAEVPIILERASKLLCKDQAAKPDCEPQPKSAIPMLSRIRDYDKATAITLELLGAAYMQVQEYQKAAESYDEALDKLPTGTGEAEKVTLLIKAAEALYKAQNFASAAERYEKAIETSVKGKLPVTDKLYLQKARSYRFAGNPVLALESALQGLRADPPNPDKLDDEVEDTLKSITGPQLRRAYELLSSFLKEFFALPTTNPKIRKAAKELPDIRERFAEHLIELTVTALGQRNFEGVDTHLKTLEALPLASLPEEYKKYYRLARAVWLAEAKDDFNASIAALTPMSEGNSEGAEEARFFLAYTHFNRARATANPSDKTDYARASALLMKTGKTKVDLDFYGLLLAVNHQLGKDQDSRQIIEEKLKVNKDDSDALMARAVLCIDYLGDLGCGQEVTSQLEARAISSWNIRMSNVLLYVLRGNYVEAEKLIDHPLRQFEAPEVILASFYRVWTSLALTKEIEAAKALAEWHTAMEKFRVSRQRVFWALDSASRGVESDQAVPGVRKDLLRRMITTMSDTRAPLPQVGDFFLAPKR